MRHTKKKARAKKSLRKHARKTTMELNKDQFIPILATIIVSIAAIALVVFKINSPLPSGDAIRVQNQPQGQAKPTSTKPVATYAPQGEITPGFPAESILDSSGTPAQSYTIDYPEDNVTQKTTNFTSDKSMATLFSEYKDYFSKNGWTILNTNTTYPTSRGIYASNSARGEQASVAIIDNGAAREVTISYAGK